jgi:hypothetical protein
VPTHTGGTAGESDEVSAPLWANRKRALKAPDQLPTGVTTDFQAEIRERLL